MLVTLLRTFSWPYVRQHPWRHVGAVLAVTLGVALALAVQWINASALHAFGGAVRAVNGQPDLSLQSRQGTMDDAWVERVWAAPGVQAVSPVLEWRAQALAADGERLTPLRLIGVDALQVGRLAPGLVPLSAESEVDRAGPRRLDLLAADAVFLNASAQQALRLQGRDPTTLTVQPAGGAAATLRLAGRVAAPGDPLAVMDIAALQRLASQPGRLSRLDLRLASGVRPDQVLQALDLPPSLIALQPGDNGERLSHLSRAYRVNLTVLALVALFTGAFLVFSVMALSAAKRQPAFALLGVLGLSAAERQRLVLAESAVLGLVGSVLGLVLGAALAALALQGLGGDLGGGYFDHRAAPLHGSAVAAVLIGALGVLAALAGGWWPARASARIAPAQALKGLGAPTDTRRRSWTAWGLLGVGAALAWLPPVGGMPLAAYVSVGMLLVGGIAALPLAVGVLLDRLAPGWSALRQALPMLALERARRLRETAAVATGGVVASLALCVALTVMVASFRQSVAQWLDAVLPAPLYLRGEGIGTTLPAALIDAVAALPEVARVERQRSVPLQWTPHRPPVTLLAREWGDADASHRLPLVQGPRAVPPGAVAVYISEAMLDLHGLRLGDRLPDLGAMLTDDIAAASTGNVPPLVVAGVWRDYARQHGSLVMAWHDHQRLVGDQGVQDLALHLRPGVGEADAEAALRTVIRAHAPTLQVQVAHAGQIRAASLRIFDRSFAVTVWLQAVAIGIGLFGVAASFSAQVMARRKEFGLLAHLGLTRAQILRLVGLEGLVWTSLGAMAGLALGLAVSLVLVHVVNPQSFHWTMDLHLPWTRLWTLSAAVVLAGTLTAWLAGRAAASHDVVRSVREDW